MAKPRKIDTSNHPYVANYPSLRDWLRANDALCMWQLPMDDGAAYGYPAAYVECWRIGTSHVIVVVRANKHGWEIYTAHPSNNVAETLADALARVKAQP